MEQIFKKTPTRIVIYPKDIAVLTGRKPAAARKLYSQIRTHYDKRAGHFLTFNEFSVYTGIDEDMIREYLRKG